MENREQIVCKEKGCGRATINHRGGRCIPCHRAYRNARYNPPVPKSRFDPIEFSSANANKTKKSINMSKWYGFMNKCLFMSYEQIRNIDHHQV